MSEQQELEEREVNSLSGELLFPVNYSFLPPSPQFSSDWAFSLWDFSDCINGNSTGNSQLTITPPNGFPLLDFHQPPYDHNSSEESFGNHSERIWIPPIEGQTPLYNFEPNRMLDIQWEKMTVAFPFLKDMIGDRCLLLARIRVPEKNGSQYVGDDSHKSSVAENFEIVTTLSKTDKLPLAQTRAPSDRCHAAGTSSPGRVMQQVFMSSITDASSVSYLYGFCGPCHKGCSLEGKAVVGRSLLTLNPGFYGDNTEFRKSKTPLAHLACSSCSSISFATPSHNPPKNKFCILEFFLSHQPRDLGSGRNSLDSLQEMMKQYFRNHKITFLKEPEEKYLEIIDFPADERLSFRPESVPTYQTNRSTVGPGPLENGEEMEKTDLVEQQSVLKFDSVYDGRKISGSRGKNPDTISKKKRVRMTLEDIQQLYGLPLKDAAERLGVSRSTLKRFSRGHGIPQWPSHKKKRNNGEQNIEHVNKSVQEAERAMAHTSFSRGLLAGSVDKSTQSTLKLVSQQKEASFGAPYSVPEAPQHVQHETLVGGNTIENINTVENARTLHPLRAKERVLESSKTIPPVSCQPRNQVLASFPSTNPDMHVAAIQDAGTITIKASYMDDMIKFSLSSSSGIAELQKEVIKRLNLRIGAFTIKYLDIDEDWILIACDEDLQYCMHACLSACTSAIKMSIQSM